MNIRYILFYLLLTAAVMLGAWAAGLIWPEHTHLIRHFFRELFRALL